MDQLKECGLPVLIASCFCTLAPLQSRADDKVLRSEDLISDEAILEQAFRTLHPGLMRYLTPAEVDSHFLDLRHSLSHDQSLRQAYLAISLFAASLRCGHTYGNFFNQTRATQLALFEATPRLPYYFEWIHGQMVITRDLTGTRVLPRGTLVTAIDANSTELILEKLLQLARADGANDAKRVAQLQVQGESRYEAFDVYYAMLFSMPAESVELEVRRPGDRSAQKIHVRPLSFTERAASLADVGKHEGGEAAALFEWTYRKDGAAYLRMPTWALYDSKWNWRDWLREHLDDLVDRKAPALIVDLRGNEGGEDVGNVILERLIHESVSSADMVRLVRYRRVPDQLAANLRTWDPSFKDWGDSAIALADPWPTAPQDKYFRLTNNSDKPDNGSTLQPHPKHFRGRVFVLVDASNSSATFQFAQSVRDHKLGMLIGQKTGGNQRGINGGAFFFLRLPRFDIEVDLPLIGFFPRKPMPDAGITPDVQTRLTVDDIIYQRDVDLIAVTDILRKR